MMFTRLVLFLLARAIWLCAVLALLILAARFVGSTQAPPGALAQYHLTECALPCWLGITLRTTSYHQAIANITAVYGGSLNVALARQGDRYALVGTFGSISFLADNGGIVRQVVIIPSGEEREIDLGDLVPLLGTPTCWQNDSVTQVFYGDGTTFAVFTGHSNEGWWAKLQTINLIDYDENPCAA